MKLAKSYYHQTYPSTGSDEADLLKDAGKQLPLVDEVHLPLIEESQPAMLRFKKGDINWIGMNKDDFNNMAVRTKDGGFELRPELKDKFQIYFEPSLSSFYIKFNMRDELLGKNKALRQAMAYALNSKKFVELLYNGRGVPLTTVVPIEVLGSQKTLGDYWYENNIEKAKEKLKKLVFQKVKGCLR